MRRVWHHYHGSTNQMAWTMHISASPRKSICGLKIKGKWLDPEAHETPPKNACWRCRDIISGQCYGRANA